MDRDRRSARQDPARRTEPLWPGAPGDDRFVGGRDLTSWPSRAGRVLARCAVHVGRLLGPHAALLLPLLLGLGVAVTMTVASAEVYESVVDDDDAAALDRPLLHLAVLLRSPPLDAAVTAFTHVGGPVAMPVLTAALMVGLAVARRSWTPVVLVTAAAAGSLLMTVAGKPLVGRARPPLELAVPPYESSASFPSGHSLNAFVVAGIVAYLLVLRQRAALTRVLTVTLALGFALAMGLSRVYLGHHWFTDVLVAQTLGAGWLALVVTAHRLHLTARHRAGPRRRPGADRDG